MPKVVSPQMRTLPNTSSKEKATMPATANAPTANGTGTTETAGEVKKSRRGGARKLVPDGHKKVTFLLKDDEHAKLKSMGDDDDREADDFAKVIVRRHIRNAAK